MHDSTEFAIKLILIFFLIVASVCLVSKIGYDTFSKKSSQRKSVQSLKNPIIKRKNLIPILQNSSFRRGKLKLHIRSGALTITPPNGIGDKESIQVDLDTENPLYFQITDIQNKPLKWFAWEDSFPIHQLSQYEDRNLYISEGGVHTEKDCSENSTLYFSPLKGWDKDDDLVFVRLAFRNGVLPHCDTSGEGYDNTIAKYKISEEGKSITVPGIPVGSILNLVVRKRNDGEQRIISSERIHSKANELWINKNGISYVKLLK